MTMLPPDPVYIFKGEMDAVSCVAFKMAPPKEYIYAGTQTGKVHVWDLKTKREIGNFKIGDDTCLSINIPQEEDIVITQNKSGNISFWKEGDNQWELASQIQTDFFGFCKASIHQDILYTALKNCRCQMISVKSKEPLKTFKLSGSNNLGEIMAFRIKVVNNRKMMVVAFEANLLTIWDVEALEKVSELQLDGCPMAVDFDPKTSKGICGDPSNQLLVFSLDKSLDFKAERKITLTNAGVASVRIRPDSKLVAVGCWDGKLRLYSWKTLVLLAVLDTHASTLQDVCFAEEYKEGGKLKYFLAAASQDGRISLWDLYN